MLKGHSKSAPLGRLAWLASVDSTAAVGLWISQRVSPPGKGMTPGYVMAASGAHSHQLCF